MTMTALRLPLLLTVVALVAAPARANESILLFPPSLDLDEWTAEQPANGRFWIVNSADAPVMVAPITVSEHLEITKGFEGRLPGSSAVEIHVAITAPSEPGAVRTALVGLSIDGNERTVPVSVKATHPDVFPTPWGWEENTTTALRATPRTIDLGPTGPGGVRRGHAWLVNTTDKPLRVIEAKSGCGCLEVPDFQPFDLAPGAARSVALEMSAQGSPGERRVKYAYFLTEDEAVSIDVAIDVIEPDLAKTHRFLRAWEAENLSFMRTLLAVESPVWFGERSGPGLKRTIDGEDSRATWDRALHVHRHFEDMTLDGEVVIADVEETSDLERLLEAPPTRWRYSFFFDADDTIAGLLIEPLDGPSPQVQAFRTWYDAEHPNVRLNSIHGPTSDSADAEAWLDAIRSWRRAQGMPELDLPGSTVWSGIPADPVS